MIRPSFHDSDDEFLATFDKMVNENIQESRSIGINAKTKTRGMELPMVNRAKSKSISLLIRIWTNQTSTYTKIPYEFWSYLTIFTNLGDYQMTNVEFVFALSQKSMVGIS